MNQRDPGSEAIGQRLPAEHHHQVHDAGQRRHLFGHGLAALDPVVAAQDREQRVRRALREVVDARKHEQDAGELAVARRSGRQHLRPWQQAAQQRPHGLAAEPARYYPLRGNGGAEQRSRGFEGAAGAGEVAEVVAGVAETLLPARELVAAGRDTRRVAFAETRCGDLEQAPKEFPCFAVGAAAQGSLAGGVEQAGRAHRVVRLGVVQGDPAEQRRVVGGAPLVPGAERGVQLAPALERQEAVDRVAHQRVAEREPAAAFAPVDQAALYRRLDVGAQVLGRDIAGVGARQRLEAEAEADHAGFLQRHLLARREPVDARDHRALDRVGHGERDQRLLVAAGHAGLDANDAAVDERAQHLADEQRDALGPVADDPHQRLGNRRAAELRFDHPAQRRFGERTQLQSQGRFGIDQGGGARRDRRLRERPGGEHQQEAPAALRRLFDHRPRRRVEPVHVFEEHDPRRGAGAGRQEMNEQFGGRVEPAAAAHRPRRRRFLEDEVEHRHEQCGPLSLRRVGADQGQQVFPPLRLRDPRIEAEQG